MFGQHYTRTALWTRFAPTWTINPHWALTADVWYRRQSDFHKSALNPMSARLLQPSGRVGVSYRTKHWAFTLFPISVFRSYPALGKEADYSRPRSNEFRPSMLVEWSQTLPKEFSVRVRGGYEYRRFADATVLGRSRFRVLVRKELGENAYVSLWNETLSPFAPNVVVRQLFELNRSNLAAGRSLTQHVSVEAGYQFTHRQRRTLIEFDEEHALTLTVFYRY